jgi:hypothetical protein
MSLKERPILPWLISSLKNLSDENILYNDLVLPVKEKLNKVIEHNVYHQTVNFTPKGVVENNIAQLKYAIVATLFEDNKTLLRFYVEEKNTIGENYRIDPSYTQLNEEFVNTTDVIKKVYFDALEHAREEFAKAFQEKIDNLLESFKKDMQKSRLNKKIKYLDQNYLNVLKLKEINSVILLSAFTRDVEVNASLNALDFWQKKIQYRLI